MSEQRPSEQGVIRFKAKPVTIEAMELTLHNFDRVKQWCGGYSWSMPPMRALTGLTIKTLEGDMNASWGDWIVRGLKGEFYPVKAAIMQMKYDRQ